MYCGNFVTCVDVNDTSLYSCYCSLEMQLTPDKNGLIRICLWIHIHATYGLKFIKLQALNNDVCSIMRDIVKREY